MGRITIFALQDCPHCKRTKGALKERGIPYTEISLTTHPNKRIDMLSLADRLTVPQVFFNDKHVGGAEDTLSLLKQWDRFASGGAKGQYERMVGSQPNPTDPRLQVPTEPPVVEQPPPPRPDEASIELPSGEKATVLETMENLKTVLAGETLKYKITFYKHAFTGKFGVDALRKLYNLSSDEEAVEFGRTLQRNNILGHVIKDSGRQFSNDSQLYFRLQCFASLDVLNSYRVWTERVDPDAMGLVKRLKKLLGKVESAITDDEGLVNYKKASSVKEHWPVFEEAVCELQGINMARMDETTRLAFGINIYNLFIKYAFMKVGIGSTTLARGAFFSGVKMNIGGDILSFNELENGVLRGNRKPPYSLSYPFATSDTRKRLALSKPDCRIHTALNCGAKSCPPVKNFTATAVDEELRIVAQAFCEQEDNVRIDEVNSTIFLSKILDWYGVDFASSKSELPKTVAQFLRGEKKDTLQRMISSGRIITVRFNAYDWGTNASEFVPFEAASIKANQKKFRALL